MTEVWGIRELRRADADELLQRYASGERDFYGRNLWQASLRGANLSGAKFNGAEFWDADLAEANLNDASLIAASMPGACLSNATLWQADLGRANLRGAKLQNADLTGACLGNADLTDADLSGADLSHSDLGRANLTGATVTGTQFDQARCSQTIFARVDLRSVRGLEGIIHRGPSTIGIDTIHLSQGALPLKFLRGCGAPDAAIDYAHSLGQGLDRFFTCFISHSSSDRDFVERLYADLQTSGVRCWYAPEDLRIGQKFRDAIDKSIKSHDKLLIVLSSASVNSEWVESELETAIDHEARLDTTVLFPIRLDDEVMTSDISWAAHVRRTRHIGDFSGWRHPDGYKRALNRLLRDLENSAKRLSR